jgi:hypothetical protein
VGEYLFECYTSSYGLDLKHLIQGEENVHDESQLDHPNFDPRKDV